MKKLLLLFSLFFSFTFYAQNVEYMKKIRNLDENGVIEVAKEISSFTRGSFVLVDSKESEKGYLVRFVKEGINYDKNKGTSDLSLDDYFDVVFEKFYDGQNKALEIEGTKKFRFSVVVYNYLDLFPYWKKYFAPCATAETTIKSIDLQRSEYKKEGNHWLYKFQEIAYGDKRWRLNKFY